MKIIQSIENSICIISIDENGIGSIHYKDNIHLDIPEQMENLKVLNDITNNHPTPFVITAGENVTLSRDARHNALEIEDISPICASAVVVQNFAYRIIADFYLKVQKPKNPFAVFTDKDKAYEWCKQFVIKK